MLTHLFLGGNQLDSKLMNTSIGPRASGLERLMPWNFLFGAFTAVWIGVAVGSILEEAAVGGWGDAVGVGRDGGWGMGVTCTSSYKPMEIRKII